jgi:hypothetical protein
LATQNSAVTWGTLSAVGLTRPTMGVHACTQPDHQVLSHPRHTIMGG